MSVEADPVFESRCRVEVNSVPTYRMNTGQLSYEFPYCGSIHTDRALTLPHFVGLTTEHLSIKPDNRKQLKINRPIEVARQNAAKRTESPVSITCGYSDSNS